MPKCPVLCQSLFSWQSILHSSLLVLHLIYLLQLQGCLIYGSIKQICLVLIQPINIVLGSVSVEEEVDRWQYGRKKEVLAPAGVI